MIRSRIATRLFQGLLVISILLLIRCAGSRSLPTSRTAAHRPNIIFIMSDDHALQAISAYQSNLIQTPHIDRIGREGAVLDGACVTNSVCSPARAVILTGKYSHINGLRDNGTYFNTAQPTFTKMLQQNGYRTALIGKWHLWSEPTGFDYWNILPAQGHYYNPEFIKMGKDTVYKGYVTDVTTNLGLDWISQNKSQPFCLLLYNKAPHRNWMPPLHYLDSFNKRRYPLPANFFDDYAGRPALQKQLLTVAEHLDIRYDSKVACDTCAITKINDWAPSEYQREIERLTPAERKIWDSVYAREYKKFTSLNNKQEMVRFQFQRYMEDYLRCVQSVDDNVGRVLKYLDDHGLADNTIIVYTSDQGFYLGEHGLYDKRFMYEESFRTPMVIRYPKHIPAGQRIKDFTLNLDVAPTLLDYTGTAIPADMQGVSMRTLLQKGSAPDWRQEVYYHYYERSFGATAHYGIRTKRYKLIHFYDPVQAWELYDLQTDPHEMKNLYGQKGYENITNELEQHMLALQQQYKDTLGMRLNAKR